MISLVILAAGFGSRFKGGVKQDYPILNGNNLMDYSIANAYAAGFRNFIFLIRKDMNLFEEKIKNKYKDYSISFVYQDVLDIPLNVSFKRIKPWGTGHAIYSLRNSIDDSFCVINADDYYGIDSFKNMYNFLSEDLSSNVYSVVGYVLENTLSSNGKVNRGILNIEYGFVKSINEIKGIDYNTNLDLKSLCSVGMFGFKESIFDKLALLFIKFLENCSFEDEFMLTEALNNMSDISIKIIDTNDNYFGMTYIEDALEVKFKLENEIQNGLSKNPLFDLENI